ncbi:uncharacterized protein LOC120653630 [Panicum virgatum]|uniref:uncharacterized protein LOC120653630 n=1 Tax=Panicum virgatum TaxID=38727 RepID=UPI0019D634ED|nr:uncharacterized protein LOC120653630 [Panicum virgatum]
MGIFVALRPCVDGFLAGCILFIGIDASCLTGKYKGQLASATGVDGRNWLYHIAYGIFESETEDSWKWFMEQFHMSIEDVPNLVISTDACKGQETAVGAIFPQAENRECMGTSRSYTQGMFQWHMKKNFEFAPAAIEYLEQHHNRIWYRCRFSENSKCDYLKNNVSESFNSQIRKFKGLLLHELVDRISDLIMEKRYTKKMLARQWTDGILPNVKKELNLITHNLKVVKVVTSNVDIAEVTILDDWNNQRRHTVDLHNRKCSCAQPKQAELGDEAEAGPSQTKKQKVQRKKKTPKKKKAKKAAADPPTTVVSSIRRLVFQD